MPASTPFLGLYKPGGGSTGLITPDEVVDIDRLNTNSDLIDAFARSYGPATERNHQLYGPAAALSGVVGMKLGDVYQESDGNKSRWVYDEAGWLLWDRPRRAFTPTWTGFTPGTSTVVAFYEVKAGQLFGTVEVTLASGFSVTGGVSLANPVTALNPVALRQIGLITFLDSGTGYYKGRCMQTASGMDLWREQGDNLGAIGPASPFTWAVTDQILINFNYKVS